MAEEGNPLLVPFTGTALGTAEQLGSEVREAVGNSPLSTKTSLCLGCP